MPSVTEKISILLQWSPILNYLITISSAAPGRDRVYRALDLLDFLATKTPTQLDNESLALIRAVLLTPQGAQLLDYLADQLNKVINPPVPQA
jgi:hypothetical protein